MAGSDDRTALKANEADSSDSTRKRCRSGRHELEALKKYQHEEWGDERTGAEATGQPCDCEKDGSDPRG